MHRSRHGIGAAMLVLLSLSVLGCTGGRPGPSRADLQPTNEASSTTEAPASTPAGQDDGQPADATPTSAEGGGSGESGGSGGTGAGPGDPRRQVPGAPVNPSPGNNQAQARGAPIKIPAFQQVGAPIGGAFSQIGTQLAELCGGRLCVELVIRPADANRETCLYTRSDPPAGATVQRGATVALICTPETTESSDTTTPDDTVPPDDTQPDATTGSDDTEPTASS